MKNTFRSRMAFLFPSVLAAVVLLAFPVRAQNFSAWSAPVNLNNVVLSDGTVCPSVVNSTSPDVNDTHPGISKDGLSLFFASTRPGSQGGPGDYDLWVAQRDSLDDCWQIPKNLGPLVNSSSEDLAPNLSTDSHWLFFHSKRTGGCGGGKVRELWATHRQDKRDDFGWEAPFNLGCTINLATADDAGPTFFDDGEGTLYLYFNRNLTPADPAGPKIYVSTCTADLDTCNTQGLWGQVAPVAALNLNLPYRNTRTAIRRRDGLEIILSTGRPGSLASENLWVSTRATTQDQNWLPPEPINCDNMPGCSPWNPQGPLVNSNAFDGGPALSWDGTELYFFRADPLFALKAGCQETPTSGAVCRDLYVSKRTKLHREDKDKEDNDSRKE